jgi:hypothetical protein
VSVNVVDTFASGHPAEGVLRPGSRELVATRDDVLIACAVHSAIAVLGKPSSSALLDLSSIDGSIRSEGRRDGLPRARKED